MAVVSLDSRCVMFQEADIAAATRERGWGAAEFLLKHMIIKMHASIGFATGMLFQSIQWPPHCWGGGCSKTRIAVTISSSATSQDCKIEIGLQALQQLAQEPLGRQGGRRHNFSDFVSFTIQ
jgi:hypothetical protein